jgi:opacity protein-like surface antigen
MRGKKQKNRWLTCVVSCSLLSFGNLLANEIVDDGSQWLMQNSCNVPSNRDCNEYSYVCPRPQKTRFGTFYVGLGLNDVTTRGSYRVGQEQFDPFSDNFPEPIFISDSNFATNYFEAHGSFSIGYETRSWCRFNLAAEAFITAGPKQQVCGDYQDFNSPIVDVVFFDKGYTDFFLNTTYGFAIMPGYQMQRNLTLFARVGYAAGKATLREFRIANGDQSSVGFTAPLQTYDVTTKKTLHSVQAGFGFNYRMSEHFYLRPGYYWNGYNSISHNFQTFDPDTLNFVNYSTKINPSSETFAVTAQYYFCPPEPYCPENEARCKSELYVGIMAVRSKSNIRQLLYIGNSNEEFPDEAINNLYSCGISGRGPNGWGGEVQAGYGYTFDGGCYVGVEGYYNYISNDQVTHTQDIIPPDVSSSSAGRIIVETSKVYIRDSYGVVVVPGFKVNDCLLFYGKFGFAKGHLRGIATSVGDPPLIPRDQFLNNLAFTRELTGYVLGGGMDVGLTRCLFLRTEFVYTNYGRIKYERSACCSEAGFYGRHNYAFVPCNRQFKLGLVYKFPI